MSKKIFLTLPEKLYDELKKLNLPCDTDSGMIVLALQLYLRYKEDLKTNILQKKKK